MQTVRKRTLYENLIVMKWIYRIFTLVLLGGALSIPFFMKNKQGDPMMSLPTLNELSPGSIASKAPGLSSDRTVFKWKDKQGVWHYGDHAPSNSTQFSTLTVNDQTNIVQSTPVPKEEPAPSSTVLTSKDKKADYTPPKNSEDVLTLERALNIVDDAHAARDMMEQRNNQLDALIGQKEKK